METNQECNSCKHGGQCGIEGAWAALEAIMALSGHLKYTSTLIAEDALAAKDPICNGYLQCKEGE